MDSGRLMGLDVGSVRVGVALSDPLGMFASPLEVILRRQVNPYRRIVELMGLHQVVALVVGKPQRLCGADGPAVAVIQQFVSTLSEYIQVPVTLWDERLSTAQAQRAMIAQNVRRQKRRDSIDKVAAAIILQSFMDAQKAGERLGPAIQEFSP